jgi:hypothetical protein
VFIVVKIFFQNQPISIKLDTNHPWVIEIQVCSNKGPISLQRGDKYKTAKLE